MSAEEQPEQSKLVQLQKLRRSGWKNPRSGHIDLKQALPFAFNHLSGYVHRVRSGTLHTWDGKASHTSLRFWCGGCGFLGGDPECEWNRNERPKRRNLELLAEIPPEAIVCATCEGRAIGAGVIGEGHINGRKVIYQPRPPLEQ